MWATLVALLIVVPGWWWARHSDESFAPDTRPLPAESRQILPTTDGPRAMTMVAHQPARPALSSVEAKPLPGNAMPNYPAAVAHAGIQGSRTARLQLDVQGRVSDVTGGAARCYAYCWQSGLQEIHQRPICAGFQIDRAAAL
ncbi:hypothetical protein [Xanthomonas citri]|uniref:hypothetical protein n=1 Tax=Xanthomonas citri TaxID=346 RepID=UPI0028BDD9F5|nr:hypothetical protein [Xanthomonas citri]